jgi:hypothetical protein
VVIGSNWFRDARTKALAQSLPLMVGGSVLGALLINPEAPATAIDEGWLLALLVSSLGCIHILDRNKRGIRERQTADPPPAALPSGDHDESNL